MSPGSKGHGNILVDIDNGEVKTVRLERARSSALFRSNGGGAGLYGSAADHTRASAAICSIGHTFLVAQRPPSPAFGITISEQTRRLRKILNHGENLQSHILHVGYLALPDLLKVGSVIPPGYNAQGRGAPCCKAAPAGE